MKESIPSFDVLNRHLPLHRNYLIEASAGTGKTFSIENIIVRLLVEHFEKGDPLTFESILVVTFTRAATRDLKKRVRAAIESAIAQLCLEESPSDYIQAVIEQGEAAVAAAVKALRQALFQYDDAQIYTIHRFCMNMLTDNPVEGDLPLPSQTQEEPLKRSLIHRIIKDFFRSELDPAHVSPVQIQILLSSYKNQFESLVSSLAKTITRSVDIFPESTFSTHHQNIRKGLQEIKAAFSINRELLKGDVVSLALQYNKILTKEKILRPEIAEGIEILGALLEKGECSEQELDHLLLSGFDLLALLQEERKKPAKANFHYFPKLFQLYRSAIHPHLQAVKNPKKIFARLAYDCLKGFLKYVAEEEKFSPDDLLKIMKSSLDEPAFLKKVQNKFRAVIVDEFQDTDPIQWQIFEKIFQKEDGTTPLIYLVGDPKQSIYAFRNADVYTYLAASNTLGVEAKRSLDTNYRSQSPLVGALNALFSEENFPNLIPLPRIRSHLPYRPVKAASVEEKTFSDGRSAVQFFACSTVLKRATRMPPASVERERFFPYIAQEILQLAQKESIPWNEIAILVRDRFQADSLALYLKECGIQASLLRCRKITDSPAYSALKELIWAVLKTNDLSAAKIALGGKIIGWTYEDLIPLEDEAALEPLLAKFALLREQLREGGVERFFYGLLQTKWRSSSSNLFQEILLRSGGASFYKDLKHLGELLVEHQNATHCPPEGLLRFLEELQELAKDDDERANIPQEISESSVNILTLHTSKGLEYDIVFALGVANRTTAQDQLFSHKSEDRDLLLAADEEDPRYLHFCEESDAEKMRQLYVALTRSRYRTYIPIIIQEDLEKPLDPGTLSPIELFLCQLGREKLSYSEIYASLPTLTLHQAVEKIHAAAQGESIGIARLDEDPPQQPHLVLQATQKIFPPEQVRFHFTRKHILSFSSLVRSSTTEKTEVPPPHDFLAEQKDIHTLPSGSETGTLLHDLLQTLGIKGLQKARSVPQLAQDILPLLPYRFQQGWEIPIAEMLWNLSQLPLTDGEEVFTLQEIDPECCWEEMEFLTPCSGIDGVEELERAQQDYLKGFIDLIFEREGRIYIIDWKSNWLGPHPSSYSQDKLDKAIASHRYDIQATLYLQAAKRLLGIVNPDDIKIAGAFYIFLRGITDFPLINQSTVYLRG